MTAFRETDLDLQDVVTANALVVHLMVSIIGIATILILDKCEASSGYGQLCRERRESIPTDG